MQIERRYTKTVLRAKRSESGGTIEGYAAKYNVISEDLGGFVEVLLPGCFDLDNSPDILCNREHNDDDPLGRTVSGTLNVESDEIGLKFECLVANTTLGRDTIELITPRGGKEIGDLHSCSFAFVPDDDGEEWGETEDGTPLRKIKRCQVFDVSIVCHPAYPNTEVALRSLERSRAAKAAVVSKTKPDFLYEARLQIAEREILTA